MSLAAGTRLGPYEVLAPIGAGGMGEVYRAKDTRLGRQVAVKVLPASGSNDGERRRRFEQEARAASALNHPNVLVVYDVGDHEGAPYLVAELLEGRSLREEILGKAMPAAKAVAWSLDAARGLAAAHDRGIVHRDLKPENLFVTRDGRVKILDFGVATIVHDSASVPLETMTWQGTEPGVVLGTVGYMSPEQVRGERVDVRSDIFSLGVVLYELLAGRRPFGGASKIETLHAILAETPPALSGTGGEVPPALERIVQHCLEKDPAARFQSARDMVFALEGVSDSGNAGAATAARSTPGVGRPRAWFLLASAGALAVAALAMLAPRWRPQPADERPDVRFEIPAPANGALQGIFGVSSAIAPDGGAIVLVVTTATGNKLFIRPLASLAATPIEGTEGAFNPFWSPDSRSIGFFTRGKLKRVTIAGGPPQTICDLATSSWTLGAWAADDTILLTGAAATGQAWTGGVLTVSAAGGRPINAYTPTPMWESSMWWPWMLPDGRRYLVWAGGRRKEVRVGSINPTTVTRLTGAESRAVYAPPGYLLFVREGTLMAQAFDVKTLQVTGTPTPIADGLLYFKDVGQADFSASDTGVLVYQAGTTASRLAWLARNGNEEGQVGQPADYFFLRLSPTGRRVAVDVMDRRAGTSDLQVFDLARRGALTHVTADEFMDWMPVFSPDEQQLAFASARGSPPRMHLKRLNESGTGTALVPPSSLQFVTDWVSGPEGQFLVFSEERPDSLGDVFMLPLSGGGRPRPLVQTPADEADGRVSPDGRSIAYVSNESGRSEVYVRALGGTTDRVQVSTGGGVSPRWRRDGGELYYLATVSAVTFAPTVVDGQLMAVSVTMKPDFRAGIPAPLFSARFRQGQYEPAADGRRFLVNLGSGSAALPITVVTNWTRVLPK